MADDLVVDKMRFDAVLRRLMASPPTSMEAAKAAPKLKKDGTVKKKKAAG